MGFSVAMLICWVFEKVDILREYLAARRWPTTNYVIPRCFVSIRETQLQSEACSVAGGVQVPNESANLYDS